MDEPTEVAGAEAPVEPVEPAAAEPEAPEAAESGKRPLEEWTQAELVAHARKLQQENVKKKERFAPIEQAFDGADPQDVQQYLTFVAHLRSGDPERVKTAAAWMRQNLDLMSPAQQEAVQEAADAASEAAGGDDEFDPFNPEAIAKLVEEKATALYDEREKARTEAEQRTKIISEMDEFCGELAGTLGVKGFADSKSVEYELLFLQAQKLDPNMPWKDRLTAAAEKVKGTFAEHGKQYMKAKSAEAESPAAPPEGGAPSGKKTPGTIAEASASAKERLRQYSQPAGTP